MAIADLVTIVAQAMQNSRHGQEAGEPRVERINPLILAEAHDLLALLDTDDIAPRLQAARSLADLRAVLLVDHFLSRVHNPDLRQRARELIHNPSTSMREIETFLALAVAHQATWRRGRHSDPDDLLYSIEGAAEQLGIDSDELCNRINRGEVDAQVYVHRRELDRLLRESDRGSGAA